MAAYEKSTHWIYRVRVTEPKEIELLEQGYANGMLSGPLSGPYEKVSESTYKASADEDWVRDHGYQGSLLIFTKKCLSEKPIA
jgi:hypothetical protein